MTDPIPPGNALGVCGGCHRALFALVVVSGLAACIPGPIIWEDPTFLPADSAAAIIQRESITAAERLPRTRRTALQPEGRICGVAESVLGPVRFRAGWHLEGNDLVALRSADAGVTWDAPVAVDARGSRLHACRPPAIFADSVNGFLHLSYFRVQESGAGVYYSHSMRADKLSSRGEGMFEAPRAIVYGDRDRAAATSVASRADTVAVAFEDPNSLRPRIMLALSTTAGHSFDHREHVSPEGGAATRPSVALRAGEIHVVWLQVARDTARAVLRIGRFR